MVLREKEEVRLQGWCVSQAMKAATQTNATQTISLKSQINVNKRDELRLLIAAHNYVRESCILLDTRIRLNQSILDSALELPGYVTQHQE